MKLSEYLLANDDRSLPTALTEGEIINEIKMLEDKIATAYWGGHTEGRLWGKRATSRGEIERGRKIITELQELGDG